MQEIGKECAYKKIGLVLTKYWLLLKVTDRVLPRLIFFAISSIENVTTPLAIFPLTKLFLIKNVWMDPMELDDAEEEVFNQDLMTRIMLDIPEVGLRL